MPENVPDACEVKEKAGANRSASELELEKRLDAFYRAYRENYRELVGYAHTLVRSTDAAQDIVQQAFTNTLTAIEGGSQIHTMGGFIYRCVRNLSMNHIAREPENPFIEDGPLLTEQSAAAEAEARGHWHRVQETLDTLPSGQRVAFLLAEVKGLRYDEIADAMGCSTSAVRQLLNRARVKVRARVDIGSDWAGTPIPVLGADIMLKSWRPSPRSSISDWVRPRVSEIQGWLRNLSQTYTDALMQSSYSLIAGLAIVALATISPAPPSEQDIDRAAPAAGAPASAALVSRPHTDSTGARVDSTSPALTAPRPSDAANRSGADPSRSSADQSSRHDGGASDDNDPATNVVNTTDSVLNPDPEFADSGTQPDKGKYDFIDAANGPLDIRTSQPDDEPSPDSSTGGEMPGYPEGESQDTSDDGQGSDSCPDEVSCLET